MAKNILNLSVVALLISIIITLGCQEEKKKAKAEQIPAEETKETLIEQAAPTEKPAVSAESKPAVAEQKNVVEQQAEEAAKETKQEPNKPGVLVTVNGTDITEEQLDRVMEPTYKQQAASKQKMSDVLIDRYKSQRLNEMITSLILEQQYKAHNISVTDKDANDTFDKLLSLSEPPMTYEMLKASLETQGMTVEEFKRRLGIKQKLELEQLLNAVYPDKLKVSDEEIKEFYDGNQRFFNIPEQVRASHILIMPERTNDPNLKQEAKARAKEKAEGILKQLKEGANFEELAKKYSDDKATAGLGGDLNLFSKEKMMPAFSDAAFALKVGEISDVVEMNYGFHIIKVTEHKDPYTIPLEKARERIILTLKDKKLMDAAPDFLKELKEKAEIVYPPGSELRAYQTAQSQIRSAGENLLKVSPKNNQGKPAENK
jgi:parvulin-like peptidyl-prolyl isomerase